MCEGGATTIKSTEPQQPGRGDLTGTDIVRGLFMKPSLVPYLITHLLRPVSNSAPRHQSFSLPEV